jgi:hypothetical protein
MPGLAASNETRNSFPVKTKLNPSLESKRIYPSKRTALSN